MINSANTTITVKTKTKTGENEYGNAVYSFTTDTFDALVGYGSTGLDYGVDRNIMTTQATIYLPPSKQIAAGAEIYIAGELYRQDGEGIIWTVPQGFSLQVGQVLPIKKVTG